MSISSFLFIHCEFETKKIRDVVASYMTRGKRPYFEEDVPPNLRKIFLALNELEYAEVKKLSKSKIELSYDISEISSERDPDEEVTQICRSLNSAGGQSIFALVANEFDDYIFYAFVSRKMKAVFYTSSDIEKELENMCDNNRIMEYFKEKYRMETK